MFARTSAPHCHCSWSIITPGCCPHTPRCFGGRIASEKHSPDREDLCDVSAPARFSKAPPQHLPKGSELSLNSWTYTEDRPQSEHGLADMLLQYLVLILAALMPRNGDAYGTYEGDHPRCAVRHGNLELSTGTNPGYPVQRHNRLSSACLHHQEQVSDQQGKGVRAETPGV